MVKMVVGRCRCFPQGVAGELEGVMRLMGGGSIRETCPYPGQRVRVQGLMKSPHYNGLLARVELKLEGGRYRVALEQGGEVISLKGQNLMPIDKMG